MLPPWAIVDGHCAHRTLDGERVAFIEKTPRVKHPDTGEWIYGNKGTGGVGVDGVNGGYQPSRDWVDAKLRELGYRLEPVIRVTKVYLQTTPAYCEGCRTSFQNIDGCPTCGTSAYIRNTSPCL